MIPYIKRFRGLISTLKDSRWLDLAYDDLDIAIANVIVDSENRGLTLEGVKDALTLSEIEKFDALIRDWGKVYESYEQLIGRPDRTAEDMLRLLERMAEINAAFLRTFTYRTAELVAKSLDEPL